MVHSVVLQAYVCSFNFLTWNDEFLFCSVKPTAVLTLVVKLASKLKLHLLYIMACSAIWIKSLLFTDYSCESIRGTLPMDFVNHHLTHNASSFKDSCSKDLMRGLNCVTKGAKRSHQFIDWWSWSWRNARFYRERWLHKRKANAWDGMVEGVIFELEVIGIRGCEKSIGGGLF